MKQLYQAPEMLIAYLEPTDILTASGEDELPDQEPEEMSLRSTIIIGN